MVSKQRHQSTNIVSTSCGFFANILSRTLSLAKAHSSSEHCSKQQPSRGRYARRGDCPQIGEFALPLKRCKFAPDQSRRQIHRLWGNSTFVGEKCGLERGPVFERQHGSFETERESEKEG